MSTACRPATRSDAPEAEGGVTRGAFTGEFERQAPGRAQTGGGERTSIPGVLVPLQAIRRDALREARGGKRFGMKGVATTRSVTVAALKDAH